jgi:cellobiose-specific phosphotransferase system component IIA
LGIDIIFSGGNAMNAKTLSGPKRMTRKEFFEESDRLLQEAQGFLEEARRIRESTQSIRHENKRMIEELRQQLLCGKN